ncbi:MAG: polysaccharide biosynthesis C-terminal domain-containing protein, partial [Gemmatimonadaceae bacterium]
VLVKERTEFLTIANWAAALVALAAFSVLVPRYLAFGAGISAVLAFSVRWGMTYFYSQRLWKVSYEWAPTIRLALVAVGVCVISALLPPMTLLPSIGVHALLFVAYLGLVWSVPILTPTEKSDGVALARRLLGAATARLGGGRSQPSSSGLQP